MTDADDIEDAIDEAADVMEEAVDVMDGDWSDDHEAALAEAGAERLTRQAFMHGVDKQLFTFLFANCLFAASGFAAWERAPLGADVDPSHLVHGLDTVRGSLIFGIALFGFFVSYMNIFHGQMRIKPFLLNAILGLSVGLPGIAAGLDRWDAVAEYLKTMQGKKLFDDISYRLGAIDPGSWLLTIGGLLVVWVLISGLLKGASSSKGAAPAGGRRRR